MRCEACGYYYYEMEENGKEMKNLFSIIPFKTKDSYDAELYACPK